MDDLSAFYVRSHFKEGNTVIELVKCLINESNPESHGLVVGTSDVQSKDEIHDNIISILKQYQEQPRLLDTHLEKIVHLLLKGLNQRLIELRELRTSLQTVENVRDDTEHNKGNTVDDVHNGGMESQVPKYNNGKLVVDIWYVSSILYTICIVRRPKTAVTIFPTEVCLVESVIDSIEDLLHIQRYTLNPCGAEYFNVLTAKLGVSYEPPPSLLKQIDPTHWRLLYVLLMWLSLLILSPFELHDFGTQKFIVTNEDHNSPQIVERSIPDRVLIIVEECLRYPAAIQQATALLISKLFCRPDVYSTSAPLQFLCWSKSKFDSPTGMQYSTVECLGCLKAIKAILKSVGRPSLQTVLPTIKVLLLITIPGSIDLFSNTTSTLIKKLHTASIGRLALFYLPSSFATWRHLRRHRKLVSNTEDKQTQFGTVTQQIIEKEAYLDVESSDCVEIIIDLLLQQLDCQTVAVRWTSAKSLSRIVQHLPFEFADQVVESIFALIESTANEQARNGACLTLAELTRSGCVLPNRLDRLIPPLCKAAQYETYGPGENRLGPATRDAACFVCWATARAYDEETLQPYVPQLMESLITVALFDRSVNCRRAASAAIQEHVGRQGLFPHGISIVTIADYFNLATMRSSYLRAAPRIAEFTEYRQSLLSCLVDVKLCHSERSVREFAAKSLGLIGVKCPTVDVVNTLIVLKDRVHSSKLAEERHGALLGLSSIINSLLNRTIQQSDISDEIITELRNIVPQLEKNRCYRGRGGELCREACCRLISSLSQATSWILFKTNTTQRYYQTLVEGLRNFSDHVQLAAAEGLHLLALHRGSNDLVCKWIDALLTSLSSPSENIAARRGFTLGLGVLPLNSVPWLKTLEVLRFLCGEAVSHFPNGNKEQNDPQTRQSAIIAIPFVVRHLVNIINNRLSEDEMNGIETRTIPIDLICDCLEVASCDDQFDRRGDVGSWVREAAVEAIAYLLESLSAQELPLTSTALTLAQTKRLFNCILRQSVDKIDRTRGIAAFLIYRILNQSPTQLTVTFDESPGIVNCSPSSFSNKKDRDSTQRMQPEWIFHRAYYSFPYEVLCGKVHRLSDEELKERKKYLTDSHQSGFYSPSILCLPNLDELTIVFNKIFDTDIRITQLSDKGLGAQSSLAPPQLLDTPDEEVGDNQVYESDGDINLGAFTSWETYHFTIQRFQKTGISLKIPQFTRPECVFPNLLPLLRHEQYRDSILAGVTNAIGVSVGFVNRFASSALLTLLQSTKSEPSYSVFDKETPNENRNPFSLEIDDFPSLKIWITETLATVGIEVFMDSFKKRIPASRRDFFLGIGFTSILRTLAILFQHELGDITKIDSLCPFVVESISFSSDFATLRAAIDLLCAIATTTVIYSRETNSSNTLIASTSIQKSRREALLCAIESLRHRYPVIRLHASEQLFARFIGLTDNDIQQMLNRQTNIPIADILDLLLDSHWALLEGQSLQDAVSRLKAAFNFS